jgi:hypothetical protein
MIAHNAKYELSTFCTRGLKHTIEKDKLSVVCTMVNEYTRNSGLQSYSLDALTGLKSDVIADAQEKGLLGEGVTKKNFWQTDWSNNPAMLRHIGLFTKDKQPGTTEKKTLNLDKHSIALSFLCFRCWHIWSNMACV